jgi:hypothetical protein
MWQMVRIEVEILVTVGGFSVDLGGQHHLLPDDQNTQEGNCTVSLYFHGQLDGRP